MELENVDIEDIFLEMVKHYFDDLRSGKLPKKKFIGKYMQSIQQKDKERAFWLKQPQVIGEKGKEKNTWLDYILEMSDEEAKSFKQSLFKESA